MKTVNEKILDKKYFIFDIDGTLLDSMEMWSLADQMVIKNHLGIDVALDDLKAFRDSVLYNLQNIHGDIYMIFYDEIIKLLGLDMTAEEYSEERKGYSDYISINSLDFKPKADELLKFLKNLNKKIGVATTTTRRQYDIYEKYNQNIINKAPLQNFVDVKVLCEDVSKKKPDPEVYLKVMDSFGCKAEDCVVFEDSLNGVISAKEAGIDVVAIYDDSAKEEQDLIDKIADYKIESFDEFIEKTGLGKEQRQAE